MFSDARPSAGWNANYEIMLAELCSALTPANKAVATALAAIPDKIRGFGHVKERHVHAAKAEEATLLDQFRTATTARPLAAE